MNEEQKQASKMTAMSDQLQAFGDETLARLSDEDVKRMICRCNKAIRQLQKLGDPDPDMTRILLLSGTALATEHSRRLREEVKS